MFGKRKLERELKEWQDAFRDLHHRCLREELSRRQADSAALFWRQLFFERHSSDVH